jgi:hypothetical protein
VLVGDDQPQSAQSALLLQVGQERPPEDLVLGVADVETEDLAAAVSGDPGGDDHGHRDDLGGGVADVQVGRVEIDVGDSVWSSRRVRNAVTTSSSPAQIRDTSDLEMPESTPRADQIVDRPGRDTADVGLHHHRIERLVDPAAGLEDDREERPLPQLRDPRLDVAGLGR